MSDCTEQETSLDSLVAAASEEHAADILLLNSPMVSGLEDVLRKQLQSRVATKSNLVLFLTTPGGSADEAYRCARLLQAAYEKIIVCVPGWCKSAGTLLAIGAHELMMGPRGELGPLDVQVAKRDELFDRDSGLVLNAALERLRDESFEFFEQFMLQIKSRSQNSITFRTAADVAAEVTVGLMGPIFDKIEPLRLGADARAMEIGSAYAVRLNLSSKNLQGTDALNMLLKGYPSHSFVIDYKEAEMLFKRVQPLSDSVAKVVASLNSLVIEARDDSLVCFLNGGGENEGTGENGIAQQTAEGDAVPPANDAGDAIADVLSAALQGRSRQSRPRGRGPRISLG